MPALGKVRRDARTLLGISNQRQIVSAVNMYSMDNDGYYPQSVATIGVANYWNWQEPTMLTGYRKRSPQLHRSISAYLRSYIHDSSIMYCAGAPGKYKYLQEAWEAGDEWNNPDTGALPDPVVGTYCFYWSYAGHLEGRSFFFRGPSCASGRHGESKLLVSDYFGYDHWRSPKAYGSCVIFRGACVTEGTLLASPYWSRKGSEESGFPEIKLHAGYTDGHVESYSSSDTMTMKVIWKIETGEPYPPGIGPGDFYLPLEALR